jgi:hypothetical protein
MNVLNARNHILEGIDSVGHLLLKLDLIIIRMKRRKKKIMMRKKDL